MKLSAKKCHCSDRSRNHMSALEAGIPENISLVRLLHCISSRVTNSWLVKLPKLSV